MHNVAFDIEIGENIDGGVGDEERFGIGRNIHDEDVADAPRGPQPGLARRNFPHQFIGMKAAFHQQIALVLANEVDRLGRCFLAVSCIDDLEPADIEACEVSHRGYFRRRTHEHRLDEACFRTLHDTSQRRVIARVSHDHPGGGDLLGARYEPVVLRHWRPGERADCRKLTSIADSVG